MRFFLDGPLVADGSVRPQDWLGSLPRSRGDLVLAPLDAGGWLGGLDLVGCAPSLAAARGHALPYARARPYAPTPALAAAGRVLEAATTSLAPCVAAALVRYDGSVVAGRFERGLARCADGWRAWGDWRGHALPAPPSRPAALDPGEPLIARVRSSLGREAYLAAVREAVRAMRRGDVYVLNLCRRLHGVPAADLPRTAEALLARTAASMGAVWDLPGRALVSASPERFISLERGLLTVEPVKGTRPRGGTADADRRLACELAACPKERAEHVMVVDLERNDLGRVCAPGTVVAAPLLASEATAYCHQLVSRVGGLLAAGVPLSAVLAATFPCGSVTGAPKRAAMEHIARLEPEPRGEYTGSLLVAVPGRLDSSVLIRTAVLSSEDAGYGVGCGITVDSEPEAEWEETLVKAAPLLGVR